MLMGTGTGENNSASVALMADKGTESWKPLEQHIPNEANREIVPHLYEYSFFPPVAPPLANPISFLSPIAAPQATGKQSATSVYPHIFLRHINSVENSVPTTISCGKEGKGNESRETLNESGCNQSSDKLEENNQPKVHLSFFEKKQEPSADQKRLLNCVVAEGTNIEKKYARQEASHGHTLISESNLNVINSNASSFVPESMVVRHTVTTVSKVLEGEHIADVPIQDEKELEKIRKRHANTLAARRRRIRQKECEKLQAVADKLSSETSELKETLNKYSEECVRIRRENKALLEEIKKMCDPDEFAKFEAQNPDMEDDIPSESSSSDQSVDPGSDIEEAGSFCIQLCTNR